MPSTLKHFSEQNNPRPTPRFSLSLETDNCTTTTQQKLNCANQYQDNFRPPGGSLSDGVQVS